jgi:hypothetical protein
MKLQLLRHSREPEASFTEQVNRVGGMNRYGNPMFDVVWSEHRAAMTTIDGELRPMYHGEPCWLLRMWQAPETYPSPFEHPQGNYEIVQPLTLLEVVNGKLTIETLPLGTFVLTMIAIIRDSQGSSHEDRLNTLKELKEAEEKAQTERIADSLQAAMPAFDGNPFSALNGKCTNVVQRKMELIERSMRYAQSFYAKHQKGISTEAVN